MVDSWFRQAFGDELLSMRFFQRFECERTPPPVLDALLADGWRHFGTRFFRDMLGPVDGRLQTIIPLRIDLPRFRLSKNQRRILRKNEDLRVVFRDARIDSENNRLFSIHSGRFTRNVPKRLTTFLSDNPSLIPCTTKECRAYSNGRLIAVSFFDMGAESASSVYACFDTEEEKRSLGIFTLLKEIEFASRLGKRFLYLGYAHIVESFYEYKKQFAATEYYDWQGEWLPLESLDPASVIRHPIVGLEISVSDEDEDPE